MDLKQVDWKQQQQQEEDEPQIGSDRDNMPIVDGNFEDGGD